MMNEVAHRVVKNYESLKGERVNWDAHWEEVAKFVIPRKDNIYGHQTIGEKKSNRLFDTEAIRSADDLAAALHGMFTNPSTIWFGLTTGDSKIDSKDKVLKWLHSSTRKMINVLNNSNFQQEILETYTDLTSIGTNILRMEEDEEEVIKFYSSPIYGAYIDENSKGDIDTVTRMYTFTSRQIMQEFGEKLSEENKKMINEESTKKWEIIHEVSPRTEFKDEFGQEKVGNKSYKYQSYHVLKDKHLILDESGFKTFPYAAPRWTKINKEKYGRSPAMKVLADIKMTNMMKKVVIQGAQLAIAPPLQVPDTAFLAPLRISPYATNFKRSGNNGDKVEPLFTGADPKIGVDIIEMVVQSIRRGFYLDRLHVDLGDRATATEVIQKRDENLRTLGPISGRLNRELLKVVINRLFGIMEDKKLFDKMPDELKTGDNLDIKYVSAIAQAQVSIESDNMLRAINASAPVIEMSPDVMDNVDGDKFLRKNMEIFGVDPEILRPTKERDAMRKARAEAAQRQQQMEEASAGADVVNKIGGNSGAVQG